MRARARLRPLAQALVGGLALCAAALEAQVPPPPEPPAPRPSAPPGPAAPAPARPATPALPGVPAPPEVVRELNAALAQAIQRLQAKDLNGVMAHVSERYRTGPLTKPTIRAQLLTMFQVYEALQARVRLDDVRLVGEQAWAYSTGEVRGRLPIVGQWMTVLWWEREPEIARRENGVWRLIGAQQ